MGATGEPGRDGVGDDALAYEHGADGQDDYGPPSELDLAWYIRNVVSRGYPPVQRGERPMDGQTTIWDIEEAELGGHQIGEYEPHHAGDENQ